MPCSTTRRNFKLVLELCRLWKQKHVCMIKGSMWGVTFHTLLQNYMQAFNSNLYHIYQTKSFDGNWLARIFILSSNWIIKTTKSLLTFSMIIILLDHFMKCIYHAARHYILKQGWVKFDCYPSFILKVSQCLSFPALAFRQEKTLACLQTVKCSENFLCFLFHRERDWCTCN